MGQDGANRYAYVYNHPTTLIDPSGFDGVYYDAGAAYGGYFAASYGAGYYYPIPNICAGAAGYYVPPVATSALPNMSYAGGQSYAGEVGNWGAAGAYSPDAYSAYMSGTYGATGAAMASHQLGGYSVPVSWYQNDLFWQYVQDGFAGLGLGALVASTYGAAAAAGPMVYSYFTGASATVATSPELVAAGTGATSYALGNAPSLQSVAPRVEAMAAEGVSPLVYGPSAGGRLADLAETLGGQTLTQLEKPMEMGWRDFSVQTLDAAAASGRSVIFDLTHMNNIPGVLNGSAYPNAITSMELNYIQSNWGMFQPVVQFVQNGVVVGAPW